MQDLDRGAKNCFYYFWHSAYTLNDESRNLFRGVRWHAPPESFEISAVWCILKCILSKFQGRNTLKISVFIATTTKNAASFLGDGGR